MLKKAVKKLQPYIPEEPLSVLEKKVGVANIVRLSANENPFGTSPKVKEAVVNWQFNDARYYPDGDARDLRQAVADYLQVQPEQLLFGCGLDEIIELISRSFLEVNDEVLEPWPTFSEYKLHAEIEGATVVDVPILTNGKFDLEALAKGITAKTKLIWLCNPNNPTGTYLSVVALRQFLQQVPPNVLVLIDEAYIDFVTSAKQPSALPLLKEFSNLLLLRTFSKVYGLANFRVGYAVVPPILIASMQAVRLPYNLNSLSQLAAQAALADQAFIQQTVVRVEQARQSWTEFLKQQGLKFYPSQTNFIFFAAPNALKLKDYLLQHGFLVRGGLRLDWLRVTFGTVAQNKQLQHLISAFYAG
ncbi:histidinol-phosphate transaminase [Loigolactobacillus backii]|uniref:histidinol-phosphate transaminase n=1 Tax=Loigolactobacillus backii TaxID=375175 RepID=UPI000C1CBB1D|nr:histidinol-phosphate transaminase [Loigolactobacillus backii]PIO82171.1 histidinol-phosphate transaminase [Loigolactobacillus backii]